MEWGLRRDTLSGRVENLSSSLLMRAWSKHSDTIRFTASLSVFDVSLPMSRNLGILILAISTTIFQERGERKVIRVNTLWCTQPSSGYSLLSPRYLSMYYSQQNRLCNMPSFIYWDGKNGKWLCKSCLFSIVSACGIFLYVYAYVMHACVKHVWCYICGGLRTTQCLPLPLSILFCYDIVPH